jgi:hypothetical protein
MTEGSRATISNGFKPPLSGKRLELSEAQQSKPTLLTVSASNHSNDLNGVCSALPIASRLPPVRVKVEALGELIV